MIKTLPLLLVASALVAAEPVNISETYREPSQMDAHLPASALVSNLSLWTADERLAGLDNELGVGYVPV